ncbi:MAG TPA: cobalamin-binding protein [Bacteroidetes bacterium]|nr:cobalamin-binding protein [Bacteroidota bacterium]
MKELQDLALYLEQGQAQKVIALTEQLLAASISPQRILNDGLIAGMAAVGEKMRNGDMYLPEVLQSAGAMQASLKILKPHLAREGAQSRGRVLMGTVKGDMHDIGKNLVGIMLQGAGFEIVDLGVNIPPEKFVEAIKTHQPSIVALSAMLTTTMLNMKSTIDSVRLAGLSSYVKIIIGGAPVNQGYADQIGADGYARDAVLAVDKVKQLLGISA